MTLAIAISLFFGFVAALSIASCQASLRRAYAYFCAIQAELRVLDRRAAIVHPVKFAPLRRPQEAFAMAAV